jgi:tRNA (mo5U34)-methyltransferase
MNPLRSFAIRATRRAPVSDASGRPDIGDLAHRSTGYRDWLRAARAEIGDEIPWYRYDILGNLGRIDALLEGEHRDLGRLAAGRPVADIGGADGDLAFVLERHMGWQVDLIDTAATNMNGLRGARALREHLSSTIEIHDVDLDSRFELPRERYGLVFLLGILYHLQSPFYVLRQLSSQADYCVLSTRVIRVAGSGRTPVADLPIAYLVGPSETNDDATNYWMFSPAGLDRLVSRTGWVPLDRYSSGDVVASDPSSPDHDERMFMLLRSRQLVG